MTTEIINLFVEFLKEHKDSFLPFLEKKIQNVEDLVDEKKISNDTIIELFNSIKDGSTGLGIILLTCALKGIPLGELVKEFRIVFSKILAQKRQEELRENLKEKIENVKKKYEKHKKALGSELEGEISDSIKKLESFVEHSVLNEKDYADNEHLIQELEKYFEEIEKKSSLHPSATISPAKIVKELEFYYYLNCEQCGTTNREIARYCKNCGRKLEISSFNQNNLSALLTKIYTERDLSPEEVQLIRKRINTWTNSIPHFIKDFGDNIEIKTSKEFPCYEVTVEFLTETRTILKRTEPYRDRKYPLTSLEASNLWNNEVILTKKEFLSRTKDYPFSRTQKVLNCETCRATGYVRCEECEGKGTVQCDECRGRGVLTCSRCDGIGRLHCGCGNGQIECGTCSGKGQIKRSRDVNGQSITYYEPCANCGGRGYNTCPRCGGTGWLTCDRCSGRGVVNCKNCSARGLITCSRCEGDGKVICSVCDGQRQVLWYEFVKQEYKLLTHTQRLKDYYPEPMLKGAKEYTIGDSFDQIFAAHSEIFLEVSTDINEPKTLFSGDNPVVKSILNLLTLAQRENKIVATRVLVKKLPVYKITYQYLSTQYEMWLFGSSIPNSAIYSCKDPVKEFTDFITNAFNRELAQKNTEKMWELYHKLEDIFGSQPPLEEKQKLLNKLMIALADVECETVKIPENKTMIEDFCNQFNNMVKRIYSRARSEITLKKMLLYIFPKIYYSVVKFTVEKKLPKPSRQLYENLFSIKNFFAETKTQIFDKILQESDFFALVDEQIEKSVKEKDFLMAFNLTEIVRKNTQHTPPEWLMEKMKSIVENRFRFVSFYTFFPLFLPLVVLLAIAIFCNMYKMYNNDCPFCDVYLLPAIFMAMLVSCCSYFFLIERFFYKAALFFPVFAGLMMFVLTFGRLTLTGLPVAFIFVCSIIMIVIAGREKKKKLLEIVKEE